MGLIYRTLSMLAKKTGIPVVLISQLNRATYTGGVPKVNHLRYSGMAEAMSALILLIYNPSNIYAGFTPTTELATVLGYGYLIVGKSRFGFKHGGPGAIQIGWSKEDASGWADEDNGWFNLVA
jgi:replicative DNA helicase